jgi:hypothetical protein
MGVPLVVYVAQDEFEQAMRDPNNLVEIHRELKTGPGRRTREVALNRAIVVLSVAAWQAYVQDVAKAALHHIRPAPGDPQGGYPVLRGQVLSSVHRFATPNAENTRDLLLHVGFDPWPSWVWMQGPAKVTSTQARERLNRWIRVRNAIAHGDDLPDEPVLSKTDSGAPSLRLRNARACISFFQHLAAASTDGLGDILPPRPRRKARRPR